MKHLKMLGLAAIAAMALMAVVGAATASATALYNGGTKLGVGSTLDFSLKAGTKLTSTDTEGSPLYQCEASTWKTKITNAGGPTTTVTGDNLVITEEVCDVPVTIVILGKSEIHWTSGTGGTITADAETGTTINTLFFGSCVYGFKAGTSLGNVTTASSGAATIHANATAIKLSGSNFACPETTKWVATYVGTEPTNLRVEKE